MGVIADTGTGVDRSMLQLMQAFSSRGCHDKLFGVNAAKGKRDALAYRVPIARILQEQKEEARLLPGGRRTDEPAFNLPALGKNYLRALQHRDLLSILPDGSRVYKFHPWEKSIVRRGTYVGADVPILDYLQRLAAIGEDTRNYGSIGYYS
jgi:lysine 2,3-aminomutase